MIFFDSSEDEEGSSFNADEAFTFRRFDDSSNLFRDGIEGVEFNNFVLAENALGAGVVTKRFQESFINRIKTFGFSGSGKTSRKHQIIGFNAFNAIGFVKREFVLC
jgi:hypothetical protein